jgi:hypothetical protein
MTHVKSIRFTRLFFIVLTIFSNSLYAGQIVDLKLNLSKGDTYYLASTNEQTFTMEMMGMVTEIGINLRFGQEFLVDEVQNNIFTIRTTFADVAFKMDMAGGMFGASNVDYDSKRSSNPEHPIANIFAGLVGKSFSMKVSEAGKIIETSGLDEIMSKVISSSALPLDPQMQTLIGEGSLRQGIEQMFNIYPGKPVRPGETWSNNQIVSAGINFDVSSNYTLNRRSNGISSLGVKGSLKTLPGSTMPGMEMLNMTLTMSGVSTGTMDVSENTGWIKEGLIVQIISGSMEMLNPDSPSQKVSLPLKMILKTTYTSKKN